MYLPDKIADLIPSKPSFPPEPDATGRILIEAAHLIRTRGHTKNKLTNAAGHLCMAGAINMALHGNADFFYDQSLVFSLTEHVAKSLGTLGVDPGFAITFNNHPSRTAAEVICALEDAAFFRDPVSA